jgi:hypothetical protein
LAKYNFTIGSEWIAAVAPKSSNEFQMPLEKRFCKESQSEEEELYFISLSLAHRGNRANRKFLWLSLCILKTQFASLAAIHQLSICRLLCERKSVGSCRLRFNAWAAAHRFKGQFISCSAAASQKTPPRALHTTKAFPFSKAGNAKELKTAAAFLTQRKTRHEKRKREKRSFALALLALFLCGCKNVAEGRVCAAGLLCFSIRRLFSTLCHWCFNQTHIAK